MFRFVMFAVSAALTLVACGTTGQPLTPAQVQANLASATYYLQAVGCLASTAASVASPVISISGDAQGNQVLSAVGQSGAKACSLTVPATALPVPAPANAPAAAAAAT